MYCSLVCIYLPIYDIASCVHTYISEEIIPPPTPTAEALQCNFALSPIYVKLYYNSFVSLHRAV